MPNVDHPSLSKTHSISFLQPRAVKHRLPTAEPTNGHSTAILRKREDRKSLHSSGRTTPCGAKSRIAVPRSMAAATSTWSSSPREVLRPAVGSPEPGWGIARTRRPRSGTLRRRRCASSPWRLATARPPSLDSCPLMQSEPRAGPAGPKRVRRSPESRNHWRLAERRPHAGTRVKSNLLDPFHPSTRLGDRRSTVWSGSSGPPG